MILFSLVFLPILIVTFVVIFITTRPTPEQNAVGRRVAAILGAENRAHKPAELDNTHLRVEKRGSFEWMGNLVKETKFSLYLQKLIVQSQSDITVGGVMMCMIGLSICTWMIVYFFTSRLLIAAIAALLIIYLPVTVLRIRRNRRVAAFNASLPDCIEMCSRSLRAGHSIIAAIDIVADQAIEPAKTEFKEVFKKQNYGLPLRDALMQMLDRVPSTDLKVLVTGILVQKDTGGNLAEILDRIVLVIRSRLRIQGEIKVHTAQGRLTGWILCLLPVVLLLVINVISPGYSSVLFHDPRGEKMLYTGIVLLLVGGFLIRHIVHGIEV